ncbi:MAG: hypothetical protein AAFO62_04470, partial [Pseudomonadota bacterium]
MRLFENFEPAPSVFPPEGNAAETWLERFQRPQDTRRLLVLTLHLPETAPYRVDLVAARQRLGQCARAIANCFNGSVLESGEETVTIAWGRHSIECEDPARLAATMKQLSIFGSVGAPVIACIDEAILNHRGTLSASARRQREFAAGSALALSSSMATPRLAFMPGHVRTDLRVLVSEAAGERMGINVQATGPRISGSGDTAFFEVPISAFAAVAFRDDSVRSDTLGKVVEACTRTLGGTAKAPIAIVGEAGSGKTRLLRALPAAAPITWRFLNLAIPTRDAATTARYNRFVIGIALDLAALLGEVPPDAMLAGEAFKTAPNDPQSADAWRGLHELIFGRIGSAHPPTVERIAADAAVIGRALDRVARTATVVVTLDYGHARDCSEHALATQVIAEAATLDNVACVTALRTAPAADPDTSGQPAPICLAPLSLTEALAFAVAELPEHRCDHILRASELKPVTRDPAAFDDLCRRLRGRVIAGAPIEADALLSETGWPSAHARLDQLGDLKPLATVLSLFEIPFTVALAAELCAIEAERIAPMMAELVANGTLRHTPADATFHFANDVVRRQAQAALTPQNRARLLKTIVWTLTHDKADGTVAQDDVARQLEANAQFADAAEHWAEAGLTFAADGRLDESIGCLERGLSIVKRVPARRRDHLEARMTLAYAEQIRTQLGSQDPRVAPALFRASKAAARLGHSGHWLRIRGYVALHEVLRLTGQATAARKALSGLEALSGDHPIERFALARGRAMDAHDCGFIRRSVDLMPASVLDGLLENLDALSDDEAARFFTRQALLARAFRTTTRALTHPDCGDADHTLQAEAEAFGNTRLTAQCLQTEHLRRQPRVAKR